jgi:ribosomal protein S17E
MYNQLHTKLITNFSNISEKIICNKVTPYTTTFYQMNILDSGIHSPQRRL